MLSHIIKWVSKVTQASIAHADRYDTPVAVTINFVCGVLSGIIFALTLIFSIVVACGKLDASILQGFAIVLASALVVWGAALRVVEIYLETVEDKNE